jgi:hypothetical protein
VKIKKSATAEREEQKEKRIPTKGGGPKRHVMGMAIFALVWPTVIVH